MVAFKFLSAHSSKIFFFCWKTGLYCYELYCEIYFLTPCQNEWMHVKIMNSLPFVSLSFFNCLRVEVFFTYLFGRFDEKLWIRTPPHLITKYHSTQFNSIGKISVKILSLFLNRFNHLEIDSMPHLCQRIIVSTCFFQLIKQIKAVSRWRLQWFWMTFISIIQCAGDTICRHSVEI